MDITPSKLIRFCTNPGYAKMVVQTNLDRWKAEKLHKQGYAPPPQCIVVFLTDRCNLRCSFCAQWGDNGLRRGKPPDVMKPANLEKLLKQVHLWKPVIILMGGEPLMYPEWRWAVKEVSSYGMHSVLITNGTLLADKALDLVKSGLGTISLSLDGPKEVHDKIRGNGAFDKVIEGIEAIERAKKVQKKSNPEITISATISEDTYKTLPELIEFLKNYPITRLSIQHLYFITEKQMRDHNIAFKGMFGIESLNVESLVMEPGRIHIEKLKRIVEKITNNKYPFEVVFAPPHPIEDLDVYYGKPEDYVRKFPETCQFIWRSAAIYPDGQVTPCLNFGAGRISERPFMEIWNSPEYREFRCNLEKYGYFPACHRCCNM